MIARLGILRHHFVATIAEEQADDLIVMYSTEDIVNNIDVKLSCPIH